MLNHCIIKIDKLKVDCSGCDKLLFKIYLYFKSNKINCLYHAKIINSIFY